MWLTPRLTITAGVDSNVYNTPDAIADESIAVVPGLEVVVPVLRNLRLRTSGSVGPHWFHKEASERYTDLFGSAGADADFGPVTLLFARGAGRYRQRFSLEIDERVLRREKSQSMGVDLRLGRRMSMSVSQLELTTLVDPTATLDGRGIATALDRDSVTRRVGLGVSLTRKTKLVPSVEFVEDRFLRESDGAPPTVGSERYILGLEFGALAFVSGRFGAGFRRFGKGQGVAPYNGLFLFADLDMPFLLSTRLSLSALRDVNYTVAAAATEEPVRNTAVNTTYRAELSFELPWKLHGRAALIYSGAQYLLPVVVDGEVRRRTDHAWSQSGVLLRHFGDHFSLGGTVQRGSRRSPLDSQSYDRVLYGATAEVRF